MYHQRPIERKVDLINASKTTERALAVNILPQMNFSRLQAGLDAPNI